MAVSFAKYQDDITKAWRDVVDSSNEQRWALFTYESTTNIIKLMTTGKNGIDELVEEFNCSLIQYAFCRVIDEALGLNKLILVNWQGESAPLSRKGLCASHVGDVANYFKGCTQTITIRNDDEATKEHLMEQILKTSASKFTLSKQQQRPTTATTTTTSATNNGTDNVQTRNEPNDSNSVNQSVSSSISPTSSVYKKVDIGTDIAASRKSFWQRQEEEEKERLAEEKRKAAEKQAQFEKERKQREEMEAKKLAETIKERDKLIEATKKADKQSSSVGQVATSTTSDDTAEDDGRVGRRSELIRLERNQETQSLISKGLIKNKRAIFEQAQQQQQNQQPTTLSRRASGVMIAKRVNAFKSIDSSSNSISSNTNDGSTTITSNTKTGVNKITDSFSQQLSMNGNDESMRSTSTPVSTITTTPTITAIKKEIEPIKLTCDNGDLPSSDSFVQSVNVGESGKLEKSMDKIVTSSSTPEHGQMLENGSKVANIGQDDNGNIENSFSKKSPVIESPAANSATPTDVITNEELIMNGKSSSIKAIALFDYQAADNTEISFDPDDQIGHIQKVDPGWWHGQVISGRFKGLIGLFPANYVQEL